MSRIKLTNEEKEALYKAEIERREREESPKKVLGLIKKKIKLTDAEKKELVDREIYRREQILRARAARAKAQNGRQKPGKPGILITAVLLMVAGAFFVLHDSSAPVAIDMPVQSVEVSTTQGPSRVEESSDFIDESPVKLADAALGTPAVTPSPTPISTPKPTQKAVSTPKPTPTPKPDVTLTVSKEYAFEGKTAYSLSRQEYYDLMDRLRLYVADEVGQMTKSAGTDYPHFESVSVSKDCSVYTVVVNDANTRTPSEQTAPDRFREFAEMYAAYNKSKLIDASVEYVTMNGNLLSKVGLVTTGAVLALSDNSSNVGDTSTRSTPVETSVLTPTPEPVRTSSSYDVWIPASGSKYHSIPNCGRMNPNKASLVSIEWARSNGYSACSKCW